MTLRLVFAVFEALMLMYSLLQTTNWAGCCTNIYKKWFSFPDNGKVHPRVAGFKVGETGEIFKLWCRVWGQKVFTFWVAIWLIFCIHESTERERRMIHQCFHTPKSPTSIWRSPIIPFNLCSYFSWYENMADVADGRLEVVFMIFWLAISEGCEIATREIE